MKRRFVLIALFALTVACGQAQEQQTTGQTAESDAPVLVVSGVDENDVLNIRAEPDANARLVGTLGANEENVRVTAQSAETLDWIHIEANGARGWVNASYLSYANTYEPLPIRLHCSGTEPFWGLELSYSRADVSFAFNGQDFRAGFDAPISPTNRTSIWMRARFDLEAEFLLLEAETCSDGMSDLSYPYSLVAKLDGNLPTGCCR